MILYGQRVSDVVVGADGKSYIIMRVRQKIGNHLFEPFNVETIVNQQQWENFVRNNPSEWMNISGKIHSERKLSDNTFFNKYSIKATYISGYDNCLSDETGDSCIFDGQVILLGKKSFEEDGDQNCLYGRKALFKTCSGAVFEGIAMRKLAKELDSFEIGDAVHLIATLMPSKDEKSPYPYLSVRMLERLSKGTCRVS
jgi:hypothetical protein